MQWRCVHTYSEILRRMLLLLLADYFKRTTKSHTKTLDSSSHTTQHPDASLFPVASEPKLVLVRADEHPKTKGRRTQHQPRAPACRGTETNPNPPCSCASMWWQHSCNARGCKTQNDLSFFFHIQKKKTKKVQPVSRGGYTT